MRRLGVLIVCVLVLPTAVARAWTWPVDGPVLRPFAFDSAHPYDGGQHRGIDIGAPSGAPVRSPADGLVAFAGTVPNGGKTDGYGAGAALRFGGPPEAAKLGAAGMLIRSLGTAALRTPIDSDPGFG